MPTHLAFRLTLYVKRFSISVPKMLSADYEEVM